MGEMKLLDLSRYEEDNLHSDTKPKNIVTYSCGSCGYELNLNSDNRNTETIGSKYGKWMKKGVISFWSIDETRFTRVEERRFFFLRRRTKLLCRKCENHIGNEEGDNASSRQIRLRKTSTFPSWSGVSDRERAYEIKIRALQPSSFSKDSFVFP